MNQPSRAGELDALLDVLADRIAERLEARQREGARGMVSQTESPLGRRRHCAAVRRRVSAGLPGAAIVGRRCLLSSDAVTEELVRSSASKRSISTEIEPSPKSDVRAKLDHELRIIRSARG